MTHNEIREFMLELLKDKLELFDIASSSLKDDFDLVGSGLLDSMAFIDLIAELEEKFQREIDFEEAAEKEGFSTMGGLISILMQAKDAG